MGMDVYGKAPTSEVGTYFRRNVWWWHPLADLILDLAPAEAAPCQYWHTNDGDGLDAEQSVALADKLDQLMQACQVRGWIAEFNRQKEADPTETCFCCGGSGVRDDEIGRQMGQPDRAIPVDAKDLDDKGRHPRAGQKGWCNGCDGRGYMTSAVASYHITFEDVVEVRDFLRASGGFEIC